MNNHLKKMACPKCKVEADFLHEPGCDFEKCSCCGQQYACEGEMPTFWEGHHSGNLEAVEYNLFVRRNTSPKGPRWLAERVGAEHPDAIPDLNTIYTFGKWSREKQKFEIAPEDLKDARDFWKNAKKK